MTWGSNASHDTVPCPWCRAPMIDDRAKWPTTHMLSCPEKPTLIRWLARNGEDLLPWLALVLAVAVIAAIVWGGVVIWDRYQRHEAAENVRIIERAVGMWHDGLCEDPRGDLADGSCEGRR